MGSLGESRLKEAVASPVFSPLPYAMVLDEATPLATWGTPWNQLN